MIWKQFKAALCEALFWLGLALGGITMIPAVLLLGIALGLFAAVDALPMRDSD